MVNIQMENGLSEDVPTEIIEKLIKLHEVDKKLRRHPNINEYLKLTSEKDKLDKDIDGWLDTQNRTTTKYGAYDNIEAVLPNWEKKIV